MVNKQIHKMFDKKFETIGKKSVKNKITNKKYM